MTGRVTLVNSSETEIGTNANPVIMQPVVDGVGKVSTGNSTTTPLASGATFTGTGEQNQFSDVYVSCITDQAGKLYFDFSNDGTNWNVFPPTGFDLTANVHEAHKALKAGRYFRARVTNTSGSAQTYLRLYTYYGEFDS